MLTPRNRELMKFATTKFNKLKADLLHVLYPNFCMICDTETPHSKSGICPICESDLQYTHFEDYEEPTSLDRLFWGRVLLENTYAMLYFEKTNDTQAVLHALKYKDRSDVAVYFGELTGERIVTTEKFKNLDALIPVPLHPKKQFLRGYNQSEMIANGISVKTGIPVNKDILKRVVFSESQTKKQKTTRWEDIQKGFRSNGTQKQFKHVALIDDVVTTGSTVETCVRILQEALPDCRISVISLAVTR